MKLVKNVAIVGASSALLAGCGISDIIGNAVDSVKQGISSQLGGVDISSGGLQSALGQASQGFSVAGNQINDLNLEDAGKKKNDNRDSGAPAFAPEYGILADGDEEKCEKVTESGGSSIADYSACDGVSGTIKTTSNFKDSKLEVAVDYDKYAEGTSGADGYYYIDGDQTIAVNTGENGTDFDFTDSFDTKYSNGISTFNLSVKGTMNIGFDDEGVTIGGTHNLKSDSSNAILEILLLKFKDDCEAGPVSGKVKISDSAEGASADSKVEVEVTGCGEATIQEGAADAAPMEASEVTTFFAKFMENFSDKFLGEDNVGKHGKKQFAFGEDAAKQIEALKNCNAAPAAPFEDFGGTWCEAFPDGFVTCIKVCDIAGEPAKANYFMYGGLGTVPDSANTYDNFLVSNPTMTCMDPFVFERGEIKESDPAVSTTFEMDAAVSANDTAAEIGVDIVEFAAKLPELPDFLAEDPDFADDPAFGDGEEFAGPPPGGADDFNQSFGLGLQGDVMLRVLAFDEEVDGNLTSENSFLFDAFGKRASNDLPKFCTEADYEEFFENFDFDAGFGGDEGGPGDGPGDDFGDGPGGDSEDPCLGENPPEICFEEFE